MNNTVLKEMKKDHGVSATAKFMAKRGYPLYLALHLLARGGK